MSSFTESIESVAAALEANSKKFEELDSVAGDGDLGITAGNIAKGLRAGAVGVTGDLKADLMLLGREIAKNAPSTFGTLFATGFIRASAAVADVGRPSARSGTNAPAALALLAASGPATPSIAP